MQAYVTPMRKSAKQKNLEKERLYLLAADYSCAQKGHWVREGGKGRTATGEWSASEAQNARVSEKIQSRFWDHESLETLFPC